MNVKLQMLNNRNNQENYALLENDTLLMSGTAEELTDMATAAKAGLFEIPERDRLRVYSCIKLIEEGLRT